MASSGKKKTTMAKRDRENRLRERRAEKQAKRQARRLAAQEPHAPPESEMNDLAGPPVDPLPSLENTVQPLAEG